MTKQELQQTDASMDSVDDAADTTSTDVENSESNETEEAEVTEATNTDATADSTNDAEQESPASKEDDTEDEGIKRIKKLNSENKSLRTRLREVEDRLKELGTEPDALKTLVSERDQYKTQYDTLLASLRTERLTNAITEASRKAGAIEPSAVIALATSSDVAVEYDAENKPTNVDAVVTNLKAKFPKLFGVISSNGNAGARNEREANLDALTPKERMAQGYEQKQNRK